MKPSNAELNKDITALKTLSIKKNRQDFYKTVTQLMAKHNLSRATIYRELKKATPGSYKDTAPKAQQRPITEREIAMVKDLLLKKIPVLEIGCILETETGEKYSWHRVDELRRIVDAGINGSAQPIDAPFVSSFGYPVTHIIEQALNLNKIAPNAYVEFRAGDKKYTLNYQETRDIALICANAIVRNNLGFEDEITYLKAKMKMPFREKIRTAPVHTSVKEYRNLSYQLKEYAEECTRDRETQLEEEKKNKRRMQYMNRKKNINSLNLSNSSDSSN